MIFLILVSAQGTVEAQESDNRSFMRDQIDKLLRYEVSVDHDLTPGFIVGLYSDGNTMVFSYGSKAPGSTDTLSPTDIFEIGSATKVFTAALFAELDSRGILSLESPVNEVIPREYRNPHLDSMTVANLLTHSAWLPKEPPMHGALESDLNDPYRDYGSRDILEAYRDVTPEKSAYPVYSNLGYALLENILLQITGLSYEEALHKYLAPVVPLAVTAVPDTAVTPGFDRAGRKAPPQHFAAFMASGGLRTNVNDCLNFIGYCLETAPPVVRKTTGAYLDDNLQTGYGWLISKEKRTPEVFVMAGRTSGHNAYLAFVPSTNTGVVILANAASGTGELGYHILRMLNNNWKLK